MNISRMLPGAMRLRALHSLIDGDGSCSLIYDLERGAVLDVPEELQFHVASAIETGDPDEDLMGWLISEDLLTSERSAGGGEADGEFAASTSWNPSLSLRDGELHARIDQPTAESVVEMLDLAVRQGLGSGRIALHLSWGGAFPGAEPLTRVVAEATRRAAFMHQEVRFELALDAWVVTPAVAGALAGYPTLHVRLHCGTFPALAPGAALPGEDRLWSMAERGALLLSGLADRLTVQCVLAGSARLHDLWSWALEAGVRRLDATRVETPHPVAPAALPALSEQRQYRGDLLALAQETCGELAGGRLPIDFLPLTRMVRRLMRSEPLALPDLYEEEAAAGDPYADVEPSPEALDRRQMSDMWRGLEEAADIFDEAADSLPCASCWARFLCDHSLLAAPSAEGPDRREPAPERCAGWRIEAEAALRLYHGLGHVDALEVRRLFKQAPALAVDPAARRASAWQQKVAF